MKLTKSKRNQLIKEELKAVLGLNEQRRAARFGFVNCSYGRKYKKLMLALSKEQWQMSGHTRYGRMYGNNGAVIQVMASEPGSYMLTIQKSMPGYEKYKGAVIMVSNCSKDVLG